MWWAPPLPVSDAGDDAEPSIAPIVDRIGPPISTTPWSPDLVAQTLEILTVFRRDDQLFCLKPIHAESLRVGLAKDEQPGDHVLRALAWYPLAPRLVHSTSWRFEQGDVVLTYVAVGRVSRLNPTRLTFSRRRPSEEGSQVHSFFLRTVGAAFRLSREGGRRDRIFPVPVWSKPGSSRRLS